MLVKEAESLSGHATLVALAAKSLPDIEQIFFNMVLLKLTQGEIGKILGQEADFALIAANGAWRVVTNGEGTSQLLYYSKRLVINFFS